MKAPRRPLLIIILAASALGSFAAQQPEALLHSLPAPPMGVQRLGFLGRSMAMDGDYLAATDSGPNSGQIKVYNSATGALLFVLPNPSVFGVDQYSRSLDAFGSSIAISGTRVVVGAPEDDTGAGSAGRVYVYDLTSPTPATPLVIENPSPATYELFGSAVAIFGSRVVVGAPAENTGAERAGSVYVFDLASPAPAVPTMTLNNPEPGSEDRFGQSVAIYGTRVAVGVPGDDRSKMNAGTVYVYELGGGAPTVPTLTLVHPTSGAANEFGSSVALTDTRLVVGSQGDDQAGNNAGSVYVYELGIASPTTPVVTLLNPNPGSGGFGRWVAISGTHVVVLAGTGKSAYFYDLSGATPTVPVASPSVPGSVFVGAAAISPLRLAVGASVEGTEASFGRGRLSLYDLTAGPPSVPVATIGASRLPAQHFGSSVGISDKYVVVGASGDDVALEMANVGNAYLYDVTHFTPTIPLLTLNNPTPAADDQFGHAVALDDYRVLIGAPGDDTGAPNAGSAYLYEIRAATPPDREPTLIAARPVLNPSPLAGDAFGGAVAISGTWGVVGASADDTGAIDAGSAYVYDLGSATPGAPILTLVNPTPAIGDGFGYSVAISGSRVVVGAPFDDGGAANAGSAYVYEINSATPTIPIAVLKSPTLAQGDLFGASVALSGSSVVVGAPGGAGGTGCAFLFNLNSGTFPVATLISPSPSPDDGFGSAVAVSDTRVVVGGQASENAYVYDFTSVTPGTPVATLRDPDPTTGDHFGASVALEGTVALIGRPGHPIEGGTTGSAYVFIPGWGLAEATDFGGNWINGSRAYTGHQTPRYPGYWAGQSAVSLDGDAAEGRLGGWNAVSTWMETTVTGPTTLYFSYLLKGAGGFFGGWATVSSAGLGTGLGTWDRVTVNTGWREVSLAIPAGVQTVRWTMDSPRGEGTIRAYVDQVWTSDNPRPRITNASPRTAAYAIPFTWTVPVASATPATLTATGLPRGLIVDANTHVIFGTPTEAGTIDATLTALNGNGRHLARLTFEIEPGTTTIAEGADAPGLAFTQAAPGTAWSGVLGIGQDGVDSARGVSGGALSITVNGPGSLSFWYRCEAAEAPPGVVPPDFAVIQLYVGDPPPVQATWGSSATNWTKATVELPAGAQTISWRVLRLVGQPPVVVPQRYVYLDKVAFVPLDAPQLAVEVLPLHTDIPVGGTQSFGEVLETSSASLTFTLKNTGPTPLTGLATTIDGPNAPDFSVTTSPVGPVAGPNGSTSFTVRFSPSSAGAKSAILRIASNDPDDSSFDINLTGTGLAVPRSLATQGLPASLSIEAAAGTSIQWRKDGVDLPGATGATLIIPSAQPWHIGVYSVRVTAGASSSLTNVALLELTDVPSALWRGLVACYPFNAGPEDMCRPAKPVSLVNTSELVADPQRGGVAHVTGKGWAVPPLPSEPANLQGPGGYLQIPRPPLVEGEPFTVSFVMKEEGLSLRHGESLFTMGEGAASTDLLGHYWIGNLDGFQEVYAGPSQAVLNFNSDYVVDGAAVTLTSPWTGYTLVADGNLLRLYRNGQLMGSSPYKKETLGDSFIGRHWWSDGTVFSTRLIAKVDDIRIYNRALSEPEVQQLYGSVQATPPLHSFPAWVLIQGLSGTDAGSSADPDRDGLSNWEEFCFGTPPMDATELPLKASFQGIALTLEWLEIESVRYTFTESASLVPPFNASPRVLSPSPDQTGVPAGYTRKQVIIPVPQSGGAAANRFFRVEAAVVQ